MHEGKEIEIVSFDPQQGAIFFILHEQKVGQAALRARRARLHAVPHRARARAAFRACCCARCIRPRPARRCPARRAFITDQDSPLKERWGGWYATGNLGERRMANAVAPETQRRERRAALRRRCEAFDPSAYLAPGSDEVALLVLAHQTQMHNLITLTNYQTRIALHDGGKDGRRSAVPDDAAEARAVREARRAAAALPAVRQRGAAAGPRRAEGHRGIRVRARVRGARPARFEGPLAARLRPAHADLPLSVQLPHLLRRLRRDARAGEELRLSPPARDPERRRRPGRDFVTSRPRTGTRSWTSCSRPSPACRANGSDYARSNQLRAQPHRHQLTYGDRSK